MKYPHTISITRTAQTISATGGAPVDGSTSTIFSGKCDAQENTRRYEIQSGIVTAKGSATVFLPNFNEVLTSGVQTDDDATITWEDGTTQTARVLSVTKLDDVVEVLYS